jgi:hypothetical protein
MNASIRIPAIPTAVRIGFAGTRQLLPSGMAHGAHATAFEDDIHHQLRDLLGRLPMELGLAPGHFLCGISQIACGGDFLFTRTCADLGMPQRIFLPRPPEAFLTDTGSAGPDFTESQRQEARKLLAGSHVIECHVASTSDERNLRFADTNLEILQASDVVVAMVRPGQTAKPGGTMELIHLAEKHGLPVCVLTVTTEDNRPVLVSEWKQKDRFIPHALPESLDGIPDFPQSSNNGVPDAGPFATHLLRHAGKVAGHHQGFFRTAAFVIIGTHVLATVCAVLAVQFHATLEHALAWFLAAEMVLVGTGFWIHRSLHHKAASQRWASARLIAELARSVGALGTQHLSPKYLFQLPFPVSFQPLLQTLNILHLSSTIRSAGDSWEERRNAYLSNRLSGPNGQIPFYADRSARAAKWLHIAHTAFNVFSIGTLVAVACKLSLLLAHLHPHWSVGALAILLPVLAVASLSLAAAFDLEARKHTFMEMHDFLQRQHNLLTMASSEREFCKLLLETESRILGESVNWFSRRAFTGIA